MKKTIRYPFSKQLIFAKVMENEELCRGILERIFDGRKVRQLVITEKVSFVPEAEIITGVSSKSVRMDVLFEDETSWYDIEMQVENRNDLPKRCRYYSSALDMKNFKKGQDYNELKTSYIIFICQFDYYGKGEALYCFERYDPKKRLSMQDFSYTIIVNTKCDTGQTPESLRTLFDYINAGKVERGDNFICRLHEEVEACQEKEEVRQIMTLEEEFERRINVAEKNWKSLAEDNVNRLNALNLRLIDAGRIDDLRKAAEDAGYRQRLFEEFGI